LLFIIIIKCKIRDLIAIHTKITIKDQKVINNEIFNLSNYLSTIFFLICITKKILVHMNLNNIYKRIKLLQPPVVQVIYCFFYCFICKHRFGKKRYWGRLISCNHKLYVLLNIALFILLRLKERRLYSSYMQVDENAKMIFKIFNSYIKRFKTDKQKRLTGKKIRF